LTEKNALENADKIIELNEEYDLLLKKKHSMINSNILESDVL